MAIDSNGNSLIIFNNNMNGASSNNRDAMFQYQLYHQSANEQQPVNSEHHLMAGGLGPSYKSGSGANNIVTGGTGANSYFPLESGVEMDEFAKNIGYRIDTSHYDEESASCLPSDIIEYQEEPIDDINNFANNLFANISSDKPAFIMHENELTSYKTLSGGEYMSDSRSSKRLLLKLLGLSKNNNNNFQNWSNRSSRNDSHATSPLVPVEPTESGPRRRDSRELEQLQEPK